WEQQPGESTRAFSAFVIYRDLGTKRSLDEASRRYHHSEQQAPDGHETGTVPKRGKSGRIAVWANRFNWPDRAQTWDREQDRELLKAQIKAVKEMRARHAQMALVMQRKAV